MGNLRVYVASGDRIWEEKEGTVEDWWIDETTADSRIRELLTNGLLLAHDQKQGRLLCPMKLSLNVERQCLVEYHDDSAGNVVGLIETINGFEAKTGVSINTSDDGIGAVFPELKKRVQGTTTDPDVEIPSSDPPHEFEVSTLGDAIEIHQMLTDYVDKIVISASNAHDVMPPADVMIIPYASEGEDSSPTTQDDSPRETSRSSSPICTPFAYLRSLWE